MAEEYHKKDGFHYSSAFYSPGEKRVVIEKLKPEKARSITNIDFNVEYFWNERFQSLLERPTSTPEEEQQRHRDIEQFVKTFIAHAEPIVKNIVDEMHLPEDQRKHKPVNVPGIAGGVKYSADTLFLKFAYDSRKIYKSDEYAAKPAGHELKSMKALLSSNIRRLHMPLMCLFNYRGHRIAVSALCPVDVHTIVAGSHDAAKTIYNSNADAEYLLSQVADKWNLKAHTVHETSTKVPCLVQTAVDIECHKGYDGRYYLIDLARLFPPEAPPNDANDSPCFLYRLLRPEYVKRYRNYKLSADAFSSFGRQDKEVLNLHVLEASNDLVKVEIPEFANYLTQKYTELSQEAQTYSMDRIKHLFHERGINLRFLGAVLYHIDSKLAKKSKYGSFKAYNPMEEGNAGHTGYSDEEGGYGSSGSKRSSQESFGNAGNAPPIEVTGGVGYDLAAGNFFSPAPPSRSSDQWLKDDIIVEVVARAFKSLVNKELRMTKNLQDANVIGARFTSWLVGEGTMESISFWQDELVEEIKKKFVLCLGRFPDMIRQMDDLFTYDIIFASIQNQKMSLLIRAQSLTGIYIKEEALEDLADDPSIFSSTYPIKSGDIEKIGLIEKHLEVLSPFVEVFQEGKTSSAELYYKTELEARKATLGENHPKVALFLQHMGEMYSVVPEKAVEAIRCYKDAITILCDKKDYQLELADVQEQLALFYNSNSQFDCAEPLLTNALSIRKSVAKGQQKGMDRTYAIELAVTYDNLARTMQGSGNFEKAGELYKEAKKIHERYTAREPLAQTMNNMGTLLFALGKSEEAIELVKKAVEILKVDRGKTSSHLATLLENLGKYYAASEDHVNAMINYREALEIKQIALTKKHISLVPIYDCIAQIYVKQKKLDEAEKIYIEALEVLKAPIGSMNEAVALAYQNIGHLYFAKNDSQKAKVILQQALEGLERTLGKHHASYHSTENILNQMLLTDMRVSPVLAPPLIPTYITPRPAFNFDRLDRKWRQVFKQAGITPSDLGDPQISRVIMQKINEIVKVLPSSAPVSANGTFIPLSASLDINETRGSLLTSSVSSSPPPTRRHHRSPRAVVRKAMVSIRTFGREVKQILRPSKGANSENTTSPTSTSPPLPSAFSPYVAPSSAKETPQTTTTTTTTTTENETKDRPYLKRERGMTAPSRGLLQRNKSAFESIEYFGKMLDDLSKAPDSPIPLRNAGHANSIDHCEQLLSLPDISDIPEDDLEVLESILKDSMAELKETKETGNSRRFSGGY